MHRLLSDSHVDYLIKESKRKGRPVNRPSPKLLQSLDTYRTPIESDESHSRANEVSDLIGVLYGIKPTAYLDLAPFRNDQDNIHRTIGRLGVSVVPFTSSHESELAVVSYDIELARDAVAALCSRLTQYEEGVERRLGRLFGYPATATDYYILRRATLGTDHELPGHSVTGTAQHFAQFTLSPGKLDEEMREYAYPLKRAVKKATPETYRRVIN